MDWKIFCSFCQNSPGPRLFWSVHPAGACILLEPHAANPARPMHVLPSVCSAGKVHTSAPLSLRLPQDLWQWAWLPWHITTVFMHTYVPPFPFPFVAFQPWRVNCYCITCMGEEKNCVPVISVWVQGIYEM